MKPKPSLIDVAKRANVAISTVSRTISGKGKISEETQEIVRKAMRELGYKPNRVARRLRSPVGSGGLIGLIIPNIQNPFFADVARGVEDTAYLQKYAVLLCNYDENEQKQQFYLDVLQSESVDGIIIPPLNEDDPAIRQLVRSGLPVVCVDRSVTNCDIDRVGVDNRRGAFDAVQHLIERGHRRIGIITGPRNSSTGRGRLQGYRDAHELAGIPIEEELICIGEFKEQCGREQTARLLDMRKPPTALFTCSSLTTIGALTIIAERKVRIPEQLALVGFDDMQLADVYTPPLSMVSQPAYDVGRCAAELLFKRIQHTKIPPTNIVLSPRLIVRKSS